MGAAACFDFVAILCGVVTSGSLVAVWVLLVLMTQSNQVSWVVVFPVLTSQSNRANFVFFPIFLFSWLWPPRAVDLYFLCYINETRTILCGSFKKKYIVISSPWWEHQPDRYLVHPLPLCVWDYLHKLLNTLEHHKLREVPWTPLLVECPQLRFGGRNIKKISIRKWSLS